MTIQGIDVSHHQGPVDWEKVRQSGKAQFAILRAGYGKTASQKDRQFEANYNGCRKNNIPVGAYWYSYAASPSEAEEEAAACLDVIRNKQFEYPIWFDIEDKIQKGLGKNTVTAIAAAFCGKLEQANYWVGVYSADSWFATHLDPEIMKRYVLWPARIGGQKPSYCPRYDMWQYTWQGNIPGIAGPVDMDQCYKDFPTMMKQAKKNGF